MPTQQILRGAPADIAFTTLDQDGQPREGGDITVTVHRANGTALVEDIATTRDSTLSTYTFHLSATETSALDILHVEWSEDGGATFETFIEVVGGYFFTLDEARRAAPNFTDKGKYPDKLVRETRRAVEEECERITGRSFVPRFRRYALPGNDLPSMWLPDADVRRIHSISMVDTYGTPYASPIVPDDVVVEASGRLTSRRYSFPYGVSNVTVEYECGLDEPPQAIKTAALMRFRDLITTSKSGIDRATFQIIEGRVFNVLQPGVRGSRTGIPEVDEAYDAWSYKRSSIASVPI